MMEGAAGTVGRAGRADAPPVRTVGVLASSVEQVNQRIRQIEDQQNNIGQGLERLVNPRPCSATDTAKAEREPDTIEAHLQAIVRRLDSVLSRAADQAETLNNSV